jgi:hypothetical protein
MLKQFKQSLRQPFYLLLFFLAVCVSVILPRNNFERINDLPSMIYFVMGFSLLFLLYGGEQARLDMKSNLPEWIGTLPGGTRFYFQKFGYWFFFAFVWYGVFYLALLLYIKYGKNLYISAMDFTNSLVYTLLCWFLLFFISILLGYSLYTWIPSMLTYVILVAIWVLINPYNYFLGFIPDNYLAWLTVGDPNIIITDSEYRLERMIINDGALYQRLVAVLITSALFFTAVKLTRKKVVAFLTAGLLLVSVGIVALAPSQKITESSKILEFTDAPAQNTDYEITGYDMVIHHGRENHAFSYEVDMKIKFHSPTPVFALFDAIKVRSATCNGKPIPFTRPGRDLLQVQLPNNVRNETIVSLQVTSKDYSDVNPTTFELLPTLPWYPMNPKEALDPYHQARKEEYRIDLKVRDKAQVVSNLTLNNNGILSGSVYGPTLLYGPFIKDRIGDIKPAFASTDEAARQVDSISRAVKEGNTRTAAALVPPKQVYLGTSHTLFTTNPDESFITLTAARLDRVIFSTLFLKKEVSLNDSSLFLTLYYGDKWNKDYADALSVYNHLSKEKQQEALKDLYQKTFGVATKETAMEVLNRASR